MTNVNKDTMAQIEVRFPELMAVPIIRKAIKLAADAHEGQARKYTNEPYIFHPLEVADSFRTYMGYEEINDENAFPLVLCVLHDTVEDTKVTFTDIAKEFGNDFAQALWWLTNETTSAKGNREIRKLIACEKISRAPVGIQGIKLFDILHNLSSIMTYDPEFAEVYSREKFMQCTAIINSNDFIDFCASEQQFNDGVGRVFQELDALFKKAGIYINKGELH